MPTKAKKVLRLPKLPYLIVRAESHPTLHGIRSSRYQFAALRSFESSSVGFLKTGHKACISLFTSRFKYCGNQEALRIKVRSWSMFLLYARLDYEQQAFYEAFYSDETGWNHCVVSGKQHQCGCVASLPLIEMLDNGGVKCVNCTRNGV